MPTKRTRVKLPARDRSGVLIVDEAKMITFAGVLMKHGKASKAAREMGIAEDTARAWAKRPFVIQHLERMRRQAARAAQITPDALAEEAATIAFAPRGKVKDADKLAGLRLLGDWHGMSKTKTEISGPNGGPIQTEQVVRVYLPHNGREALPETSKDG